jgi:hypothetical protein
MSASEAAPVEDGRPPPSVLRVVNPVLRALLRSPLHRLAAKNLMLVTMTGRKSGRTITVPVGRHEWTDGTLVLAAAGGWRHNLRGGADVRVTLDGKERPGRFEPESDPDKAAETFKALLDRTSPRAMGVKVNGKRSPTTAELKPVLAAREIGYVRLTD